MLLRYQVTDFSPGGRGESGRSGHSRLPALRRWGESRLVLSASLFGPDLPRVHWLVLCGACSSLDRSPWRGSMPRGATSGSLVRRLACDGGAGCLLGMKPTVDLDPTWSCSSSLGDEPSSFLQGAGS
jgi:hypothetical protein